MHSSNRTRAARSRSVAPKRSSELQKATHGAAAAKAGPLEGQTVVLTGTLSSLTRDEASRQARSARRESRRQRFEEDLRSSSPAKRPARSSTRRRSSASRSGTKRSSLAFLKQASCVMRPRCARAFELRARALRADPHVLRRARRARSRDADPVSEAGNTEPNIESFSTTFGGPRRRRLARALAAHVARARAEAAARGRRRRLLRARPRVPQRRSGAAAQSRIHDAGVVSRRLGSSAADARNRRARAGGAGARSGGRRGRRDELSRTVRAGSASIRSTRSIEALRAPLADIRASIRPGSSRDDWLDLLITHRLQPAVSARSHHASSTISRPRNARWRRSATAIRRSPSASRCFSARYELANGYHELTDAAEQRARFERDNARRRARGQREVPIDERLLAALAARCRHARASRSASSAC